MKRMSCGNCGYQDFAVAGDDNHFASRLEVTCLKCNSATVITVIQPKMSMDSAPGSAGELCFLKNSTRDHLREHPDGN